MKKKIDYFKDHSLKIYLTRMTKYQRTILLTLWVKTKVWIKPVFILKLITEMGHNTFRIRTNNSLMKLKKILTSIQITLLALMDQSNPPLMMRRRVYLKTHLIQINMKLKIIMLVVMHSLPLKILYYNHTVAVEEHQP
jgi:hypothetical protein